MKPLNVNINKGNTLDADSNIGDGTLVLRTRILDDFIVRLYYRIWLQSSILVPKPQTLEHVRKNKYVSRGIWYAYVHFVQCTYNSPIWWVFLGGIDVELFYQSNVSSDVCHPRQNSM